jgi:hypothetical protein
MIEIPAQGVTRPQRISVFGYAALGLIAATGNADPPPEEANLIAVETCIIGSTTSS